VQLQPKIVRHPSRQEDDPSAESPAAGSGTVERFVDIGVKTGTVRYEYDVGGVPATRSSFGSAHVGLGIRRLFSRHSDLGTRIEVDNLRGRALIGVRALDYRYRIGEHLAMSVFMGVARYDAPTVALGWYGGAGVQWRNLFHKCDLSLDFNLGDKLQRDKLAPGESAGIWPDAYYSVAARTLSISRRF